jgi:uncharacterized protein YjiS (DUF1127 family)
MPALFASLFRNAARRRTAARLLELDDHLLNDIGVSRFDLRQGLRRRAA